MHNPIELAITTVNHSIPREILNLAFDKKSDIGFKIPVHEVIRQEVIVRRVLPECNISGGNVKQIPLKNEYLENTKPGELNYFAGTTQFQVYRIPPNERDNVGIAEAMRITPPNVGMNMYTGLGTNNGSTVTYAAANMLASYTNQSYQQTPRVELLSGDLVCITPGNFSFFNWILSVRLAYDENFTNLGTSSLMPFVDLVLSATKSYIYNKMIIQVGRAFLDGGLELAEISEIIRSYSDQEDKYKELLLNFTGSSMLDPNRLASLLPYIL